MECGCAFDLGLCIMCHTPLDDMDFKRLQFAEKSYYDSCECVSALIFWTIQKNMTDSIRLDVLNVPQFNQVFSPA